MELSEIADDVIKMTGNKSLRSQFYFLDGRQADLLGLLEDGKIDQVDNLLKEYEKLLRKMVSTNTRLLRYIRKWRTWKTKASIGELELGALKAERENLAVIEMEKETIFKISSTNDRARLVLLQDQLNDIKELKNQGGKGSIIETATIALNSLERQFLEVDKKHIRIINSKIAQGLRQYQVYKILRDLSRLLFEVVIGLIGITIILGYVINLIPVVWLSAIVLPALLWFFQRNWVNKWLDKKLLTWRIQNLKKSINWFSYVRKYVECLIVVTDYLAVRVTTIQYLL